MPAPTGVMVCVVDQAMLISLGLIATLLASARSVIDRCATRRGHSMGWCLDA